MPPIFPRPRNGHLTLYIGGGAGGVGESIVLHMPDGHWIVIDVCSCHDTRSSQPWNFPLTLLRQLNAQNIALLAITHPDHDHFNGLQALVRDYSGHIDKMWTFPRRNLREMANKAHEVLHNNLTSARHQLFEFLDYTIHDSHDLAPITPQFPTGRHSSPQQEYSLRAVMPTSHDLRYLNDETTRHCEDLRALGLNPQAQCTSDITRALQRGEAPRLEANMLSLGLVIQWGTLKIFLPGDMEIVPNRPGNWSGMLTELDRRPETRNLLDEVNVVKAPHHGSLSNSGTGLHAPTWDRLHKTRSRVPYVLLTPKNGGTNPPPQRDGLAWIASRAHVMGMTSAPRPTSQGGGWDYVTHAQSGWMSISNSHATEVGSWVMLDISPNGYITRRAGDQAAWFVPQQRT